MDQTDLLIERARQAMRNAYAPYSQFPVGSALLAEDGAVIVGCNVENAAYGPTNCAERTALFSAIAAGYSPGSFRAIAVIGDTEEPIAPCGVCRQVMSELCAPDMPVIMANLRGMRRIAAVRELLPGAFALPASRHAVKERETP
jgi:cytidine deaminase